MADVPEKFTVTDRDMVAPLGVSTTETVPLTFDVSATVADWAFQKFWAAVWATLAVLAIMLGVSAARAAASAMPANWSWRRFCRE